MTRKATFLPYQPKTILNKGKRADHWFWTRYSAYPDIGCQHGCEFCYCREQKYCPHDDPLDFAYVIKVKENAPGYRLWDYRKAAWAVEELEQDIGLVYRTMGLHGLQSFENVGVRMGTVVEKLIRELG